MTGIERVRNEELGVELRTHMTHEGRALVSAEDLAKALEYSQTQAMLKLLRGHHIVEVPRKDLGLTPGRAIRYITEGGMYRAIMRSGMEEAEKFQDWVTDELLPTVRRAEKVGIDVVSELKEQIARLEESVELTQSEATGAYLQLEEAYEKAYRAARLSSSKDTWAMNVYSGKTFNIPPKYQTSMEEWKRLAEEEGWDM